MNYYKLKLDYRNGNRILDKWDEAKNFIHTHDIDIMPIGKTKLTKKKYNYSLKAIRLPVIFPNFFSLKPIFLTVNILNYKIPKITFPKFIIPNPFFLIILYS